MHSSDTTSASRRIFGHNLPADLIDAILQVTHIPLLSEGWFVAGIVWGFSVTAVTFVFFGSVFFSGMAHANPAAVRTTLNISILIGLIYGVAGLAVNRLYNLSRKKSPRGPSPELHRAVAWHRLISADLLLLLGLAGLWHAWLFSPLTRALGVLTFTLAVALGIIALPAALMLITGKFKRVLRILDRILLLGIGLTSALISIPAVVRAEPGAFFLLISQVLVLLALPWVAPMLAVARIHFRHARALTPPAL